MELPPELRALDGQSVQMSTTKHDPILGDVPYVTSRLLCLPGADDPDDDEEDVPMDTATDVAQMHLRAELLAADADPLPDAWLAYDLGDLVTDIVALELARDAWRVARAQAQIAAGEEGYAAWLYDGHRRHVVKTLTKLAKEFPNA